MIVKFIHQTAAIVFICLLFPLLNYAQDQRERTIEKLFVPYPASRGGPLLDEPVELVDLKVEGRSVKPDTSFVADDDWLKGLTVTLKNISGRPLWGLGVTLEIPIIDPNVQPFLVTHLNYGRDLRPLKNYDENFTLRPIEDGQSITLVLTDGMYSGIQHTRAERGALPTFDRVRMYLIFAVYDDDTAWVNGQPVRRDPDDSGRWSVIRPEANSPE